MVRLCFVIDGRRDFTGIANFVWSTDDDPQEQVLVAFKATNAAGRAPARRGVMLAPTRHIGCPVQVEVRYMHPSNFHKNWRVRVFGTHTCDELANMQPLAPLMIDWLQGMLRTGSTVGRVVEMIDEFVADSTDFARTYHTRMS